MTGFKSTTLLFVFYLFHLLFLIFLQNSRLDLVEKEPAPPRPMGPGGWYSRAHLSAGRGARALP